ncbi:MAG: class I SAM-dependent methyltransferase [Thermodesulfobacteriota bacterium]
MQEVQEMKETYIEDEDYNYEPFADTEEYKQVNSECITSWVEIMKQKGVDGLEGVLDVATGAGTMVQLVFDNFPQTWKKAAVLCLDQSSGALKLAQSKLEQTVETLKMVHSSIQDMTIPDNSVDIAVWGNGIHYLSAADQLDCVKRIRKALKPGGFLFFNTAFYEEARPAETLPFYRTQVKTAVQYLRDNGVKRVKSDTKTEAAKFLPRSYYESLVEDAGFKLVDAKEFAVDMHKEAWEYISAFQQYAAGALRGYPIDDAVNAMRDSVGPSIELHGVKDQNGEPYITRKWLAISAQA